MGVLHDKKWVLTVSISFSVVPAADDSHSTPRIASINLSYSSSSVPNVISIRNQNYGREEWFAERRYVDWLSWTLTQFSIVL